MNPKNNLLSGSAVAAFFPDGGLLDKLAAVRRELDGELYLVGGAVQISQKKAALSDR